MGEQMQHHEPERRREEEPVAEMPPTKNEEGEKLKGEMDDLLEEIDDVLETNAEEFVKAYIQKGGQ